MPFSEKGPQLSSDSSKSPFSQKNKNQSIKDQPRSDSSLPDFLWGLLQIEPLPVASVMLTMLFRNRNDSFIYGVLLYARHLTVTGGGAPPLGSHVACATFSTLV